MKACKYLTSNSAVVHCLMGWPRVPLVTAEAGEKENESSAYAPLVCSRKETLTHYWHLCVWGVKCYITQRSEKSKRLEAEMEKAGEAVFFSSVPFSCKNEIESAEGNRIVLPHGDEERRWENSSRKTSEACVRAGQALVWLCVWKTSGSDK